MNRIRKMRLFPLSIAACAIGVAQAVELRDFGGGAVLTRDRDCTVVTCRSDASFKVTAPGTVDVLLVGGGGGGGSARGGGGGGGGVQVISNLYLQAGTYAVTVGAGGEGGDANLEPVKLSTNGGETRLALVGSDVAVAVAAGGGAGGNKNSYIGQVGSDGANGGGASARSADWDPSGSLAGGLGLPGGFAGGCSTNIHNGIYGTHGGGGGGAGACGGNATANLGGDGGDGLCIDLSGVATWYGGGGGGSTATSNDHHSEGGLGGGGDGGYSTQTSSFAGEDGEPGTGGGGGGGGGCAYVGAHGGAGGSGVAIFRIAVQPQGLMLILR